MGIVCSPKMSIIDWRRAKFLVAFVQPLILLACGADRKQVEVLDAAVSSQESIVQLAIAACHADSKEVDVDEDDASVTVTVWVTGDDTGRDCADSVTTRLSQPLGERLLIDGTTGGVFSTY